MSHGDDRSTINCETLANNHKFPCWCGILRLIQVWNTSTLLAWQLVRKLTSVSQLDVKVQYTKICVEQEAQFCVLWCLKQHGLGQMTKLKLEKYFRNWYCLKTWQITKNWYTYVWNFKATSLSCTTCVSNKSVILWLANEDTDSLAYIRRPTDCSVVNTDIVTCILPSFAITKNRASLLMTNLVSD